MYAEDIEIIGHKNHVVSFDFVILKESNAKRSGNNEGRNAFESIPRNLHIQYCKPGNPTQDHSYQQVVQPN